MNNKTYLYSYLFTLIGGVLMVVLQNRAGLFEAITIIIGIMFLVPGLLMFIRTAFPTKSAKVAGVKPSVPAMIVSGAAVVFGIVLIAAPHLFTNLLVYAFGALMIICGIMQLANFSPSMKSLGFPWWYMATPVLCIAIGVVVIVIGADRILNLLALITGIVLIVYGVNGLIGYFDRSSRMKRGGVTGRVVSVD